MASLYLDSAERIHRANRSDPVGGGGGERPDSVAFDAATRRERPGGSTPAGTRRDEGSADPAARTHRADGGEPAPAEPAPRPGESPVTPERAERIGAWVAQHSDSEGALWWRHSSAEKIADALAGRSELGALGADEQRHLMDGVLARWADGRGDGANGPGNLVRELPDDPGTRAIVAERTALRAGMLADRAPPRDEVERHLARTETAMYARAAVEAVSGPAGRPADDLAALRDMVGRLGPEGAAGLARALDPDPAALTPPGSLPGGTEGPAEINAESTARTLAALNDGPRTEATGAFVQNVFALATPNAYMLSSTPRPGAMEPRGASGTPDLRQEMATALAREWHPNDPAKAAAEARRLHDILDTPQGLDSLAARSGGPALDARVNALATLRLHPEITADTLRATRDAWTNPAITDPAAQAQAQPFLARGDAAQVLRGSDLDNTVGVAMGQEAKTPPGMTPGAAEAALTRGEANLFQDNDSVRAVSGAIRRVGGEDARVTVLPVTYSSGATGPVRLPLFRVETAAGERFVDNQGRSYDSFEHWRTTNALPPGIMHYPAGGHLSAGPDGRVRLEHGNTPKTVDTFGERVGQVLDTAALVGGVVVTGLVIAGTGGTAALVIGVGAAAWNGARGVQALHDRAEHGQSLSLADPQARGLWLGLAADTAGVAAFGSAARLARLGRTGRAIAPMEASAHGYVQAGAHLADTAAIGNQGVDLVRDWDAMAPQDRVQAVLQMGFWGAASLAGSRASGSGAGEMFNPVAIRDSLLQTHAPPVRPDPALRGDAVRIVADRTGAVQEIRVGPQATEADVALHVRHAQLAQRTGTLEARLDGLLRGGREPPPGSEGWAARLDLAKMREANAARAAELNAPGLSEQRRAQIEQDIAADQDYMAQLAARVGSFERSRETLYIDAPPSGDGIARQMGADHLLDDLNRERVDYVFVRGPGNTLEVRAKREGLAQYEVRAGADGAPELHQTKPGVPFVNGSAPINSRYAGEVMPRSALTPYGQQQYSRGLTQLPAAMRLEFEAGIRFSADGFPQFPSVFQARVPEADYAAGRSSHFKTANEQVLAAGREGLIARGLTGQQADDILASIQSDRWQSPKGWTWHHTENPGELVLVPFNIHNPVKHTGGEALWGGGAP